MRIASVTATPFRIPFARTIALSTGVRSAAEHVLVRVETDDGVSGHAECVPRPTLYGETFATAPGVIEDVLAPLACGIAVSDVQRLRATLTRAVTGNPTAKAAIELAAFDAYGRTIGAPAHRLLGGDAGDVACCPMLGYGAPAEVLEEACGLRDRYGVGTIKFKIGPDVENDVAVARALRDGLGDGVELYPDANSRYAAADALTFADRTRELRLRWLEEPVGADDPAGRRRVADHAGPPVIGDESCQDAASCAAELGAGRCGGVSIKLARTAIVESVRIRELCAALGAPSILGSQGDTAIGASASASFAAAAPQTSGQAAEVMFFLGLEDDLLTERPVIAGGRMTLSERPGFGFEIDSEKLAHYAAVP